MVYDIMNGLLSASEYEGFFETDFSPDPQSRALPESTPSARTDGAAAVFSR